MHNGRTTCDADLIHRVRRGDERAFHDLVDRHAARLHAQAAQYDELTREQRERSGGPGAAIATRVRRASLAPWSNRPHAANRSGGEDHD